MRKCVAKILHNFTFSCWETSKHPEIIDNQPQRNIVLFCEIKLTPKLINARLTGCRDNDLHGCFTFSLIWTVRIYIHTDDRYGDLLISWRVRRVTARTIPAIPVSLIVTCFLPFLSFSLRFQLQILCVFSFHLFLYIFARCFLLLFQIQIREIAKRIVTLRLENWPFGYRFEMPNSMDVAGEMITLHLSCAKEINKNEVRPSRRRWWKKGKEMERVRKGGRERGGRARETEIIMYLIVESLPGLDLQ